MMTTIKQEARSRTDSGKKNFMMQAHLATWGSGLRRIIPLIVLIAGLLVQATALAAETKEGSEGEQPVFATPEEAATALVDAIRENQLGILVTIIGPGSQKWLFSGDAVDDQARLEKFVAAYEEKNMFVAESDDHQVLNVGKDDWPFPVPLVKSDEGWRYDTEAGRTELLARRIGRNELNAIQVIKAIADAQVEYARADYDGDGLLEYAQKFKSSPGQKDGLYWPTEENEIQSPLGDLVAYATTEGYHHAEKTNDRPLPYHGYLFRILMKQGKDAPGGAYNYVVRGHMIGGFAVIAYPVRYGTSGVMTFIINHDGVVYEKDIGPDTIPIAEQITRFNPGTDWNKVP